MKWEIRYADGGIYSTYHTKELALKDLKSIREEMPKQFILYEMTEVEKRLDI